MGGLPCHWGSLLTKWAPYIDFSHEYSPVNDSILQITHRIEYMTQFGSCALFKCSQPILNPYRNKVKNKKIFLFFYLVLHWIIPILN